MRLEADLLRIVATAGNYLGVAVAAHCGLVSALAQRLMLMTWHGAHTCSPTALAFR